MHDIGDVLAPQSNIFLYEPNQNNVALMIQKKDEDQNHTLHYHRHHRKFLGLIKIRGFISNNIERRKTT